MDKANGYDVENMENAHCPLAAGLNRLYRQQMPKCARMQVPDHLGQGFWERIQVNSAIEVTLCDVTFHHTLAMRSKEGQPSVEWGFSLADPIQWTVEHTCASYELKAGEMSSFGQRLVDCIGYYQPGARSCGITVKLDTHFFADLSERLGGYSSCYSHLDRSKPFQMYTMTPSMKRIVYDIMRCDYPESVKRVYLEGKVLELAAVYLHEVIGRPVQPAGLSRTDMDSLLGAKAILELDLLSPPSLQQLSRRVYLNEYKLKSGFKQLFGQSVHAYVIDCRLEQAYRLLEGGSMTITAAAMMSGFSKPSHFAKKFREKYGLSPSQYFSKSP